MEYPTYSTGHHGDNAQQALQLQVYPVGEGVGLFGQVQVPLQFLDGSHE